MTVTWESILDDIDRAKRRLRQAEKSARKAVGEPDAASAIRVLEMGNHVQRPRERDGEPDGPEAA